MLTESDLRGDFRATLNGRSVPYFRVNHAFKGLVIPSAGVWEVAFVYRPKHWTAAWIAAGAGMLLVVGLAKWCYQHSGRSVSTPQSTVSA